MSALGQKQTCALQNVMSALHPIATANADSAKGHVCFTPKADMCAATRDVRFGPIADIGARQCAASGTRPFTAFANDS